MSGARIETFGQIRNIMPYGTYKAIETTITPITGATQTVVYADVLDTDDIPFDYGPDKAGRVYTVINGYGFLIQAGTYNAADFLSGRLFFIDTSGNKYLLGAIGTTIVRSAFNFPNILIPRMPLFSPRVARIGQLLWQNNDTLRTTAANVDLVVNLNIGYYGDYAEYDFDNLTRCEHHHYHGVEHMTDVDTTKV